MADIFIRRAVRADLPAIVAMLADDPLGALREVYAEPLPDCYVQAFEALDAIPAQHLMVAAEGDDLVGTYQLTILPGIALRGMTRGQIEAVRVRRDRRSAGIGALMIARAIEQCREAGCGVVQLTTNKTRADAHRFYDRLGFTQSHFGYKLMLSKPDAP